MPIPQLEAKDITFFLAVKPYMSTRAQRLLDVILFLTNPGLQSRGDAPDPVPLLTLLHLVKNTASPPPPPSPVPELPRAPELVKSPDGEEKGAGERDGQGGGADEGAAP
ncbi:MAG TPA: hypothetical protein GX518_03235 [Firmicutes bacterium]|nr:hypothetical protein [Bacillota bacterium]